MSVVVFFLRHGARVVECCVPVRAVGVCDRRERAPVYTASRGAWGTTRRPRQLAQQGQCGKLPEAVLGLGEHRGQRCGRAHHGAAQPAHAPMPIHMHHAGVLPPAGPAIQNVPDVAANAERPSPAQAGRQVRHTLANGGKMEGG